MISPEMPPAPPSAETEAPLARLLATVNGTEPEAAEAEQDLPKVSAGYIWLMVLAQLGAFITPIAISLSVKVSQITPGQEQNLGYILGAGSLVVMLTGPLLGILSDRTRSRLGRRRPFIIAGTVLGTISLVVMA